MNEYRLPFSIIVGGPEKGRLVFKSQDEEAFKPWRVFQSFWATRRPGC